MIGEDHIRGLSLPDEGHDDLIHLKSLMPGKVDTGAGRGSFLLIFSLGKVRIIGVFVRDRAMTDLFRTAVADIGGFIKPAAVFPLKTRANLVAFRACPADTPADDKLITDICFLTAKTVDAKVVLIGEASLMVGICHPAETDLLRNGRRIFTQIF